MDTVKFNAGAKEWTLGELNRVQARQIIEDTVGAVQAHPEKPPSIELKEKLGKVALKTILWSINNAVNWPTKENQLGSDTEPYNEADLDASFTFKNGAQRFSEIHTAVLKLNDLFQAPPGEAKAEPESPSIGTNSASA
jgi:hypothetical protein